MAAAPPRNLASDLYQEPAFWDEHDPDYLAIDAVIGGGVGATRDVVRRHLTNLDARSPVALAVTLAGDNDHIYVVHSLSVYPASVTDATPFDNCLIGLCGNDFDACTAIVLPNDSCARTGDTLALNIPTMTGPAGHAAGPPAFTFGPHAPGAANTDQLNVRRAVLLPPDYAHTFLSNQPTGRYTKLAFYTQFLQAPLDAGGAAAADIAPVAQWYRLACTWTNNHHNEMPTTIAPVTSVLPIENAGLNAWVRRVIARQLARLGRGGPGLTTAAFNQGIADVTTAIVDTSTARLEFERARNEKTFTDAYGATIAQLMYNLTGQADDDHLPEIHRVLARSPKSRAYAIVASLVQRRVAASTVPLTDVNMPIFSTKLIDEVFRSFQPAGTGVTFGQGLTPFAFTCEGHKEANTVREMVKRAEIVESGGALSVSDAEKLTSTDARLPTTPQQAAEKLYAWSIGVDLFHGENTAIARNVREFVLAAGPCLHANFNQAGTEATGMDIVCRIMFEAQQEYFMWVTACARENVAGLRPAAPGFERLKNSITTFRANSLSVLPASWYSLLDAPRTGTAADRAPRSQAGATPAFNAHANSALMTRFRDSPFNSVSAMMEGHDVSVPKHGGKDVCLVWALKGQCSSSCKRKANHVRYSAATNKAIGELMTACGVPNPQE